MKIVFAARLFRASDVTACDTQLRVVFINKNLSSCRIIRAGMKFTIFPRLENEK